MGSHGENRCYVCGSNFGLTWVSWVKTKRGKGVWLCPQHDAKEAERYAEETD